MFRNLMRVEVLLEIGVIEVIKSRKEACCFCQLPQHWSLVVYYNHKPIGRFPCCGICYNKILAVLPKLKETIKEKIWIPMNDEVPAYFRGEGFENDLRLLLGFPLLPRTDEEGVEPVKSVNGSEWEAESV